MSRGLDRTRRQWERHGSEDPYWGVLGASAAEDGRWDHEEFFRTGREHVDWVLAHVEGLGVDIERRRALDFGCGVGRLTAGLAARFDEAHGVDASATMLAEAKRVTPEGVTFHLNTEPHLGLFPDAHFDLVLTYIVLQHIPSTLAMAYVADFIRLLTPTGVAVFQAPESLKRPKTWRDSRVLGVGLRNLGTRAKAKVAGTVPMEMHMNDRRKVAATVERAGGELVEVAEDWTGGDYCTSVRYVARRRTG